jgi:hypothetical protein
MTGPHRITRSRLLSTLSVAALLGLRDDVERALIAGNTGDDEISIEEAHEFYAELNRLLERKLKRT